MKNNSKNCHVDKVRHKYHGIRCEIMIADNELAERNRAISQIDELPHCFSQVSCSSGGDYTRLDARIWSGNDYFRVQQVP